MNEKCAIFLQVQMISGQGIHAQIKSKPGVSLKGRGRGINSSQSKNVGKIQLSMQLSHLSIGFENIWF